MSGAGVANLACKIKELVIDFGKKTCFNQGYEYGSAWGYTKMTNRTGPKKQNTERLYKKNQRGLFFLSSLRSFKLLSIFYDSVVVAVLFNAIVCRGGVIKDKETNRL